MSEKDFANGKLSYEQQDLSQKYKIKSDMLGNQKQVKVVRGDESFIFDKGQVYGFRDDKKNTYRFYKGEKYRILNNASLMMYSRELTIVNGKAKTRETRYFFSKEPGSALVALTIQNLKKSYPGNRSFHDLLDLRFRNDKELAKFDTHYNEYTLKSVLEKSISVI